jgi:hypothetical protein
MAFDVYTVLNFRVIDTNWEVMQTYNWIYQPFNFVEGLIWWWYIVKTARNYWSICPHGTVSLQCFAFLLFGVSDLMEVQATTVLLVLFKVAILVALILGHRALLATRKYPTAAAAG